MALYQINPEYVLVYLRSELKKYICKHRLRSLVLGVSGGIDSAVIAAIARPVCDELQIPLIGRSLPSTTNADTEISRATLVGKAFCTDFDTTEIDAITSALSVKCGLDNAEACKGKLRQGNIKARVRMILLYDLAQSTNGCVLSTDNLTEYYLGFWTLHGDVGDIGMIQNIWKTDVYRLARHIVNTETNAERKEALKLCIDAVPTDGLGITKSDLEQIGAATYKEVDDILYSYIFEYNDSIETHPVIVRYRKSKFKRQNPNNFAIPNLPAK
jgi:NAD+ synthetase